MKLKYRTRKDEFTFRMVLVGYLILIVCVGLPILFAPKDELQFHWALLLPLAIVLFMLYVLTDSMMKFFTSFVINENGVKIFLPPFHRRNIPRNQIENVKIFDVEESRQIFEDLIKEQFAVKEDMDIARYVRLLRKKAPAFKYLSIAPSATLTTKGQMEHLTSLNVKSKERMIMMKLKDGKNLYLSPDDIDGFIHSIDKIIS